MHSRVLRRVRGDAVAVESRGARAVVRAVPGWTNGDADRDLARVAACGRLARIQRHMILKNPRYSLILLCLALAALLAGCKQPAAVAPAASAPEQAAAPSPSPS